METVKFKKSSWHYFLADVGGFNYGTSDDRCSYVRAALQGTFMVIVVLALFALVAYLLVDLVFGLIFSMIAGAWLLSDSSVALLIIFGGVAIWGLCLFLQEKYESWRRTVQNRREATKPVVRDFTKPDSFIVSAYKGWKEKYCVKVEIIE